LYGVAIFLRFYLNKVSLNAGISKLCLPWELNRKLISQLKCINFVERMNHKIKKVKFIEEGF